MIQFSFFFLQECVTTPAAYHHHFCLVLLTALLGENTNLWQTNPAGAMIFYSMM
jgi:hypothetical protein